MNIIQKEILNSVCSFEIKSQNEIWAQLSFKENFTGFDGHFDEKPVLPAICLMEIVKCLITKALSKKTTVKELISAKFYNVITANEKSDICIKCDSDFLIDKFQNKELIFNVKFSTGEINKKANLKLKILIE